MPAGAPRASRTRGPPVGSITVTVGGVFAPERTHTIPPGPQSSEWCQPLDSSRAPSRRRPEPRSADRSRPRSGRSRCSVPSGDHANERCPGPHVGAAWSWPSSRTRTRRTSRPTPRPTRSSSRLRRRRTRGANRRVRSGAGRSRPDRRPQPPGSRHPRPTTGRATRRTASTAGPTRPKRSRPPTSAGSQAKSPPVDTFTGQADPSSGTLAMWHRSPSSTETTTRPSGETAGAAHRPRSTRTRTGPPATGTATSRPSSATWTTSSSDPQHQAPPP